MIWKLRKKSEFQASLKLSSSNPLCCVGKELSSFNSLCCDGKEHLCSFSLMNILVSHMTCLNNIHEYSYKLLYIRLRR